ncbi:nucleotide-diphospho-sugar transferase [Ramicandelaber brevisporus]|nr:nucleotide-diphospho-sugar transferase [Ramicandelaber brevisporus]
MSNGSISKPELEITEFKDILGDTTAVPTPIGSDGGLGTPVSSYISKRASSANVHRRNSSDSDSHDTDHLSVSNLISTQVNNNVSTLAVDAQETTFTSPFISDSVGFNTIQRNSPSFKEVLTRVSRTALLYAAMVPVVVMKVAYGASRLYRRVRFDEGPDTYNNIEISDDAGGLLGNRGKRFFGGKYSSTPAQLKARFRQISIKLVNALLLLLVLGIAIYFVVMSIVAIVRLSQGEYRGIVAHRPYFSVLRRPGAQVMRNGKPRPVNGAFVVVLKNEQMHRLKFTLRALNDRFNGEARYPLVVLLDGDDRNGGFIPGFESNIAEIHAGDIYFGTVPAEHWNPPDWVDGSAAAATERRYDRTPREIEYYQGDTWTFYVRSSNYYRYMAGFFFRHPLLDQFDYIWRIEPQTDYMCDVVNDPFETLHTQNKTYGFFAATKSNVKPQNSIEDLFDLWSITRQYVIKHPEWVRKGHNSLEWIVADRRGATYNFCAFGTEAEVMKLDFLRSREYLDYFTKLDATGGFLYNGWRDRHVRSLALAMFKTKDDVHHYSDLGFFAKIDDPYYQCPKPTAETIRKCSCDFDASAAEDMSVCRNFWTST